MKKLLLNLLTITLLAGCAASGIKQSEMKSSIPPLKENQARVYFYRDNSIFGAAMQPEINLDGKVVGKSMRGGFFYVDTTPGPHIASNTTEVERNISFVLEPKEVKYIRTSISLGVMAGRANFELVPAAQAEPVLMDLSYTGDVNKK